MAGTSLIGQSIVIVATVTFLGLGTVQAEKPSLGTLVADAARGTGGNVFGSVSTPWWIYVFPSVLLVLMLLCVNFLGDTLDVSLEVGAVVGASLAADWVFSLGGMASLTIAALGRADPFELTAVVITLAIVVIAFMTLADLVVGWLDPRARITGAV